MGWGDLGPPPVVVHRGGPPLLAVQKKYLAAGYPASPGGGPWLRMTSPCGEMASEVPSGCTITFQPRRRMHHQVGWVSPGRPTERSPR